MRTPRDAAHGVRSTGLADRKVEPTVDARTHLGDVRTVDVHGDGRTVVRIPDAVDVLDGWDQDAHVAGQVVGTSPLDEPLLAVLYTPACDEPRGDPT
jgi:hypothetical protein